MMGWVLGRAGEELLCVFIEFASGMVLGTVKLGLA